MLDWLDGEANSVVALLAERYKRHRQHFPPLNNATRPGPQNRSQTPRILSFKTSLNILWIALSKVDGRWSARESVNSMKLSCRKLGKNQTFSGGYFKKGKAPDSSIPGHGSGICQNDLPLLVHDVKLYVVRCSSLLYSCCRKFLDSKIG